MNKWTRIFFREPDAEFDRRRNHSERPVWIFVQSEPENGVRGGRMCKCADQSLETREFFFDEQSNAVAPSHWLERGEDKETPEAPGASFLLCGDGEPHDWVAEPADGEDAEGGEVTVCLKCHAVGDSS